jgi:predicted Zn-dependent peptidase
MLHAKIDSQGIATQKKVVIEEKKQRYDNRPYGSILIETMKRAYTRHPYRWTTIGDTNDIRSSTHEDVRNFYETFYVPNNAVLTVAGDIQKEESKRLIRKYFETIPEGTKEIPRPDVVEPIKHEEIRDTVYDNIRLPAIIQAYHIPAMGTDDYYAVDMLSTLLSEGQSSRLYKTLVDEKEMAMQVALIPLPFEDPGLAITFALPNMGKSTKKLEEAMDEEIKKVRKNLISDREFKKLKNQFETQIVRQNSTIARRAQNLASNYTYFENTDLVNQSLDKYMEVTKEDLKRVANKYFREDNRVVLYYLPQSEKEK